MFRICIHILIVIAECCFSWRGKHQDNYSSMYWKTGDHSEKTGDHSEKCTAVLYDGLCQSLDFFDPSVYKHAFLESLGQTSFMLWSKWMSWNVRMLAEW